MTTPNSNLNQRFQQAAALLQQGSWAQAEKTLTELSKALPQHSTLWFLLGTARAQLGHGPAAEQAFRKSLALNPTNAEAQNNLGFVLEMQGRTVEAKACYERAIHLNADYANAHFNLANVLQGLGALTEAELHFRAAIHAKPDYVKALNNLGLLLLETGNYADAVECLLTARTLAPEDAEIITNGGHAHYCIGQFETAIVLHERALTLAPGLAQAHSNLGMALQAVEQFNAAARAFEKALSYQPDFAQATHNLAHLELASGQFAQGWLHYTSRPTRRATATRAELRLPADLSGKTIFLRGEQGLGDELFFLRFAPELAHRGATVKISCAVKLKSLLSRVSCLHSVADTENAPADSIKLLVGDLPYALGHDEHSAFPPPLNLTPQPDRVAAMRQALVAAGPPPYVGLTWRAGTKGLNRLDKNIPLSQLRPLLAATDANTTWIALQRQPLPQDLAELGRVSGRTIADFTHVNDNLEDMLALLSLLDDYGGVSNTNMHLRAGLGLSAQVLVPYPPDWRWLLAGDHSPWFPQFELARQSANGDWTPAITQCCETLAQRLHRPLR